MENITIRQAGPEDLDKVRELKRQLDEETADLVPAALRPAVDDPEDDYWRGAVDGTEGFVLLAQAGSETVGMLLAEWRGACLISDLIVLPDYRGKGLGTRLVREAGEVARKRGSSCLTLHVLRGNDRAEKLYRALGFETWRTSMICEL